MVSREMRFVLVKLRGDGRGDCFVAAPFFFSFFPFITVLSISVVPEVELERRDLSLFFTFVSSPIVVARNLEGIWHLGELDFITVF